jgi:hypothetical protein
VERRVDFDRLIPPKKSLSLLFASLRAPFASSRFPLVA